MNKVFLDIGAWTGNSIARFNELYEDNEEYKIYSFEPHPDSAKRFKINHPEIPLVEAAVWTSDTERTLRVGAGKWIEGCTLVKAKRVKRYDKSLNMKVKCIDFAKWMRKHLKQADYIVAKFNIEGAEYVVLKHLINEGLISWFDELWVEWHCGKMGMSDAEHIELVKRIPQDVKHWNLDHKRKAIYTVITDNKYSLIEPLRITSDWDYVCYTSTDKINFRKYDLGKRKFVKTDGSDVWQIRHIPLGDIDCRKLSRKIKILHDHFMSGNDVSIYADTRFTCNCNLDKFVDKNLLDGDIAVMRHNRRNCLFKEADYLMKGEKITPDDIRLIKKQVGRYRNFIIPNYGLWAPGIMIRKHGVPGLEKMMRVWYEEMLTGSHRDMLSFAFAYKKYAAKVELKVMDFKSTYEAWMVHDGDKPRIA